MNKMDEEKEKAISIFNLFFKDFPTEEIKTSIFDDTIVVTCFYQKKESKAIVRLNSRIVYVGISIIDTVDTIVLLDTTIENINQLNSLLNN